MVNSLKTCEKLVGGKIPLTKLILVDMIIRECRNDLDSDSTDKEQEVLSSDDAQMILHQPSAINLPGCGVIEDRNTGAAVDTGPINISELFNCD